MVVEINRKTITFAEAEIQFCNKMLKIIDFGFSIVKYLEINVISTHYFESCQLVTFLVRVNLKLKCMHIPHEEVCK